MMVTSIEAGSLPLEKPCKKCNKQEATLVSRTEAVCQYVWTISP